MFSITKGNRVGGFEFLGAVASRVAVPLDGKSEHVWMNRAVRIDTPPTTVPSANRVTAVIGRNGTGKSHMLASIVETFVKLEALQEGRLRVRGGLPLERLRWRFGSDEFLVTSSDGRHSVEVNGHGVVGQRLTLPSRLVALTITPFDKFLVTRTTTDATRTVYRYLGLRDRTGRASMENLLFRSLAGLFESSDNEALKRARISRAFEFLGLKPRLTIVYRMRIAREVMRAANAEQPIANAEVIRDKTRLRRVHEAIERGELDEYKLAAALRHAALIAQRDRIRIDASFESGSGQSHDFEALLPLRMVGFIQLNAVEVKRIEGPIMDLKRASSGQLSMATAILALAAVMRDDSLVLIDEPELSLHPEWQVRYIGLLLETFESYKGCHFIIATHSPLIVAELPPNATLVSLDDPDVPSAPELAGQSSDVLLAEAFGLPERNNLHLRDLLVAALRAAADGEAGSGGFRDRVEHLKKVTARLPPDDGIHVVLRSLADTANAASNEASLEAG
jgi:hypothetical protein